jgi:preprotein translocase subunit SecA
MLGVNGILKKIFGDKTEKDLKEIMPYVLKTKEEFEKLGSLSHDELRGKTFEFKERIATYVKAEEDEIAEIKKHLDDNPDLVVELKEEKFDTIDKLTKKIDEKLEEVLLEILPEAFAVVKETATRFSENETIQVTAHDFDHTISENRVGVDIEGDKAIWHNTWIAADAEVTWNMVHYDVQLIGGIVLHNGDIAEMQTGEGKTLVATLPCYLNALTGKGVHLITVNNYLAKRDSEWMGPIYEFHGLTVDCIDNHEPHSEGRKAAYKADIIFGTNNEFGFDYLRDNMSSNIDSLVQGKHHYSIVDEVDSVLVDDARTPLIISGPTPKGDIHEFHELKPKVEKLYAAQRKLVTSMLTEAKGKLKALDAEEELDKKRFKELSTEGGLALLRCFRGLPKNKALIKFLSEPGIKIQLQKTENFYLQDQEKEMHKVDVELFFTIDEKSNSIELTEKGIDLISGSEDPNFYIMPDIGALVAEIEGSDASDEIKLNKKESMIRDYTVKSERIHTINQLVKAYTLFENDVEYVVMDNKVKIVDEQTGRIMEGRRYSDGLHQAIEAKENVTVEAATQTYATITLQNYFRMYHKLSGMTGTAETEAKEFWDIYELDVVIIPTNRPIVRDDRQDLVFKTAREKYNAIIDEVIALREAGRPSLVGTTSVEISELLSRMLKMRKVPHNVLNAKLHQREAEIVTEAGKSGTITIATNMAGRGTDIKLGEGVKEAGGLAIIGTERHDSRRVDRQLRGRAGRQGDPGSSQFFVSLEDHLMRLFGSEKIAKLMDRMGLKEGEVIQHSMISKSIARAQGKVEENNFGVRKRLLEYDDVMNAQRKAVYQKRRNALYGDRLEIDILNMFYDVGEGIATEFQEFGDFEGFKFALITTFSIDSPITEEEFNKLDIQEISQRLFEVIEQKYKEKCAQVAERSFPVISNVYENQSSTYENIVVPFSDGIKTLQIVANLKDSYDQQAKNMSKSLEKSVVLANIDNEWKEHLREMDDLRTSVQQARHEQKDPLLIYKLESFDMFKKMMDKLGGDVVSFLLKANLPMLAEDEPIAHMEREAPKEDTSHLQTSREDHMDGGPGEAQEQNGVPQQQQQPVTRTEKKINRNEKVKILNIATNETKTVKYKVAEPLLQGGRWQIIEHEEV